MSSSARGNSNAGSWQTLFRSLVLLVGFLLCVEGKDFVKVKNFNFVVNGKPFYFVGFNSYWLGDRYRTNWERSIVDRFLADAQKLGLTVARAWAFNTALPRQKNDYDEAQFRGLDYMIAAADKYNIRLVLALGNLWNAFKGPEHFLNYATGSADGKTVLDFYQDRATRDMYKAHISRIVNRVNTITGKRYRDDPTIMAWNVMNEPRCPGCDAKQQQVHHSWVLEMVRHLKAIDPNHLISLGTEGFFQKREENAYHLFNPGAGGQCEGEDWLVLSNIKEIDFSTLHVYERHMESFPQFSGNPKWSKWEKCNFQCYLNWFVEYIDLHERLSLNTTRKPMVLEEFGATWWHTNEGDRKVLFKLVYDKLANSKKIGGSLAGAMFWNAAHKDMGDYDGYNVYIQKPQYFSPDLVFSEAKMGMGAGIKTLPSMSSWSVTRNPYSHEQLSEVGTQQGQEDQEGGVQARRNSVAGRRLHDMSPNAGRSLMAQALELDGFRRGWWRQDCARKSAKDWKPYHLEVFMNMYDLDTQTLYQKTQGLDIVQVIADATRRINN